MLSDYPGSDEAVMAVKIKAGLIRATAANLQQPNPKVLTELPPPGLLSNWLRHLALKAGLKSAYEVHQEDTAAGTKTDRLLSIDDEQNAELYGHLVWDVRNGKV